MNRSAIGNLLRWHAARHLGLPAMLAVLLALAAAWMHGQWLPDLRAERTRLALRQQARVAERGTQAGTPTPTPESASQQWLQALPPADRRGQTVASLLRRAEAAGLQIERADYTVQDDPALPVSRLAVSVPVTGTYAQIRAGMAGVLDELPSAALESLQLERGDTRTPQLRATAQFVVHFRQVPK